MGVSGYRRRARRPALSLSLCDDYDFGPPLEMSVSSSYLLATKKPSAAVP